MAKPDGNRDRLIELVRARSLSSSDLAFDTMPTLLDAEGAYLTATLVLDSIKGEDVDLVGSIGLETVPLVSAIAVMSHTRGWPLQGFVVRSQAGETGANRQIAGLAPGETLQGKHVVLVDDVTATGAPCMQAIGAVKAAGASIVRVVAIIDRLEGAADSFGAAGIPFTPLLTIADFR